MTTMYSTASHVAFPALADPAGYRPCPWDLAAHEDDRAYWLDLFRKQFDALERDAMQEAADRGEDATHQIAQARAAFMAYLDDVSADPLSHGPLDILSICENRERVLREAGIADPYRLMKAQETERAMRVLPGLLEELDAMPVPERRVALVRGVFAGNIFDAGATETIKLIQQGGIDFATVRAQLRPRPWHADALDRWLDQVRGQAYKRVVAFVDNAGPDIVLGMLPFVREVCREGAEVILTANTGPALNDITHDELLAILAETADFDPLIREAIGCGQLRAIASGNAAPLIDLSRVSNELAQAVAESPIDLVILEGMGRSIESNYDTRFTCDVLRLAMIKDAGVARRLNAQPFDLVMRFDPAR
jgi:type II pantothenate kinase